VRRLIVVVSSVGLLLTGINAAVIDAAGAAGSAPAAKQVAHWPRPAGLHARHVCAETLPGIARCMSLVLVDSKGRPFTSPAPSGLGPADFQDAYNLPSSDHGKGMTVAVIDAYHHPTAEADLAVYRSTYGLSACTTQNGCFTQITSHGDQNWAPTNSGWGLETALDLDTVSAICPNCNILLVESYGGWIRGLGKAVNEAVSLGANAISNSYDNREKDSNVNLNEKYFNHPGVAITVASGDWSYNNYRTFPTSSNYVVAVGGTYLHRDGSQRGWSETAWSGSGSGCSDQFAKPKWQTDTGCKNRTYSDVAADASPTSGAAVYDTEGYSGWLVVGGTSLASPIIASVFALAGDSITYGKRVYQNPGKLYDVTSGNNGSCSPSYLCTAGPGFDGPTGLGTPNGIGDF